MHNQFDQTRQGLLALLSWLVIQTVNWLLSHSSVIVYTTQWSPGCSAGLGKWGGMDDQVGESNVITRIDKHRTDNKLSWVQALTSHFHAVLTHVRNSVSTELN